MLDTLWSREAPKKLLSGSQSTNTSHVKRRPDQRTVEMGGGAAACQPEKK